MLVAPEDLVAAVDSESNLLVFNSHGATSDIFKDKSGTKSVRIGVGTFRANYTHLRTHRQTGIPIHDMESWRKIYCCRYRCRKSTRMGHENEADNEILGGTGMPL